MLVAALILILIVEVTLWVTVMLWLARRSAAQPLQANVDRPASHPSGRAGPIAALVLLMLALLATGTALGVALDSTHRQTGGAIAAAFSAVGFLLLTWTTTGVLLLAARRTNRRHKLSH